MRRGEWSLAFLAVSVLNKMLLAFQWQAGEHEALLSEFVQAQGLYSVSSLLCPHFAGDEDGAAALGNLNLSTTVMLTANLR